MVANRGIVMPISAETQGAFLVSFLENAPEGVHGGSVEMSAMGQKQTHTNLSR